MQIEFKFIEVHSVCNQFYLATFYCGLINDFPIMDQTFFFYITGVIK